MRRKILEGADIRPEINRLIKDAASSLTIESSRINKRFKDQFLAVFNTLDSDLVEEIGLLRKEKDRAHLAQVAIEEAYSRKEAEIGSDIMRKLERDVYLRVLDALWMQHLENMQHLREGIHWRSVGQRDPLVEYRSESQKLFDNLERNLREEVLRVLLNLTKQEAALPENNDEEYDSELTKMAETATEKGVNEISAGDKNLDSEFRKDNTKKHSGPNTNANTARNKNKKKRKQQRKNRRK